MFKRLSILLCSVFRASACSAGDAGDTAKAPRYTDGDAYVTLSTPHRYSDQGKVEVVEVFSYACVHCAHFAPYMDKLEASLPEGVVVHYIPANFSRAWEPFARAYYAARELGVAKATHDALFKDKFINNFPLNSLSDLADFYARHGVDRAAFLKAAKSDKTTRQMATDTRLIRQWHVDATPTIVVDGKYLSHHVKSYDELVDLTRWLVERELKGKVD